MIFCIAGKNNIAVHILEFILFEKHIQKENVIVCCNKNDNGKNGWQRSLRFTANLLGIKEVQLEDVYKIDDLIFLSLEFDRIIKPCLFKSKKLFNVHFSLLPCYKGMYTAALPLLNNEKYTGVTFHYIDSGIDTGAIIAQRKILLDFDDTSHDVYLKNIKYGTELVKECINKYLPNEFNCEAVPQDLMNSSYYSVKSLDYSNIQIDLRQTALSIHNQIRAFNFREYQLPVVNGQKIRYTVITGNRSNKKPGTVIWQDNNSVMISTIDYDIVLYYDKFDFVIEACKSNDVNGLKQIPSLRYYVNEKTVEGWSPLIIATYNGFYDMAMYLIENRADIHVKNNNGTNLLMYAKDAFLKTGDARLFEFYYSKGLSVDEKDYTNKALSYYCKRQNINQIGNIVIG